MALDLTSFDAALKQYYTDDKVENLVYSDHPLLAMIPKMEDFGGKNLPIPLLYGNPQGRSSTFSNAQTRGAATNSELVDFVLTRAKDYSIATIDNETLEASKGNKAAFMEAATTEIDGAIQVLSGSIAHKLYRDSSGYLAQVSAEPSEASSTVITLKQTEEITSFEIGMDIVIWSAKSGGSQRTFDGSTTAGQITAVDRDAGTITINVAYDASGTIAADDFLFVNGDRGNALSGLEGWIPSTAPGATSFFGVDRSVDTNRLGGVRYDGSAQPIEEALVDAASRLAREGGKPDFCFMNYAKYAELEKSLGSKVNYIDLEVNAKVGFRGMMIHGPRGPIRVVPDQNSQADQAYMLTMKSWKLRSLGKAVKVIDSDGLSMLRQASSDGVEVRYGFYGNLGCQAPGWNAYVNL